MLGLVWSSYLAIRRQTGPGLFRLYVGLLDLQILMGALTYAALLTQGMTPFYFPTLLHGLLMLLAVVLAHVLARWIRRGLPLLVGYLAMLVALIAGLVLAQTLA